MAFFGSVLSFVLWLYLLVLVGRAVLSLVPVFIRGWQPRGLMLLLAEATFTLTDPPLRFLRRFIPSISVGGVTWDLAFLALYVLVSLAMNLIPIVFA